MVIYCINEEFEYFEQNIIREGSDCHPLVMLAFPDLVITL